MPTATGMAIQVMKHYIAVLPTIRGLHACIVLDVASANNPKLSPSTMDRSKRSGSGGDSMQLTLEKYKADS